jgi:predicted transcriptional regulator
MSRATTVKLPEALKKRIAPLAKAAGKTPHAWMVEALASQIELAERRVSFVADALNSMKEVEAGGPIYDADQVFEYLRARVRGRKPPRPAASRR